MVTTVHPVVATVGRYLFPVLMASPGRQSWPQDADCPLATEPGACGRQELQSWESSLLPAALPPRAALSLPCLTVTSFDRPGYF